MIIVDFNGLPGCGKSTYVSTLYKKITEAGDICYLFNKNEYMVLHNKAGKIKDYMRLLLLPNFVYCIKMLLKWKKTKFNRKISIKDKIWKTLRIVILDDKIHRLSKIEDGILLIDQGIIQDYADFFIDKELSENEIMRYTNKFADIANKIIFVNCKITVEETIKRIKKRDRKKYDVDKMPEKELKEYLRLQQENLTKIRKKLKQENFTILDLDTTDSLAIDTNINKIINNIEKRG